MSEAKQESSAPKRGGWIKRIVWAAGGLLVLMVVAYFVVTSGGFIKSVILPKVGAALNADLAVADLELSPFSQLVLRDVKLTPKGAEPLLAANLVRVRYSLTAILRGNILVEEVTVESPIVTLIENADGTSNLDPLLKSQKAAAPKSEATPSAPLQLDIKSVALKNATVKRTKNLKGGAREVIELSNVNLTLANLKNGSASTMELSAGIAFDTSAPTNAANVAAKLSGNFTFDLTSDLKPAKLNGKAAVTVEKATGAFADLANLAITLDADATPTEVRQLALRFAQAGQALGEIRVSGPFDSSKSEGKLNVAILSLDRRVLNLAGAASGIDFGTTLVNSTNVIELTQGGAVITAAGQLDATRVRITRQQQTTPTLDLRCEYAVTVDNAAKSARLQKLNLTGTQDTRPLLKTELTSPMTIAFGSTSSAVGDATLNVTLTGLNLADWRAFAADLEPAGTANAKLKLLSQQGGKLLNFDLDATVTALSAKFGSNAISRADVSLRARGTGTDLKQFKLDDYRAELAQSGQPALTLTGSGTFDSATQDADLQVALRATIAKLLAMFPQPDANFSNGSVELTGRVTSKQQSQSVTGKFALANLTGRYADFRFAEFGSTADVDLGMKDSHLDIRQAAGELHEGANPGGKFGVTGRFDTARKAGQFSLALTNFNQNGLRPFLESSLGDKQLVSVSLNTTATANLEANGDAAVKASLQITNLVVKDPKGSLPTTPLEAKAQLDAGVAKSVATIRQCQFTLTPTGRAKNELNLTGSVDFSKTNAITGLLKLAADSLDVTRYYDLFAGDSKTATKPTAHATAPATDKEPEAVRLPFSNFSLEATIGKFYLREVEATNFQFVAKLDPGRVVIKPAQFALNGAPVSATADLDLSVPGYKYDVAFNADRIPLEPLVNSFVPERKGQIHGTTIANAQIKGAGVTGASLQKNLTGQFSFASTNLGLSIANVRNPIINVIINAIVAIPDLIRNPGATFGNLLAGLTGGGSKGGFAGELTAHPIQTISARGRAGGGRVTLEQAEVKSAAFEISADGDIGLAPILTNSTLHIPVHVSLSRPLAEKVGLAGNTPTNQPLANLPDFLTVTGTVGKPKPETKGLVLVALALKASGGVVGQLGNATGDKVGGALNLIGGLLGGGTQPVAPSANTATNAPATNAPVTNAPATKVPATNAPTSNVQTQQQINLLDLFKQPKKQ